MQATKGYLHGSLSRQPRKGYEVWELRYRLPTGKESDWVVKGADGKKAKVWDQRSRTPDGFMTEKQAWVAAQRFLDERADTVPEDRKTFGRGANDFLTFCEIERGLRGSTLHDYRALAHRLCQRPWGQELTWRERPLESFAPEDVLAVRKELVAAGRSRETINHYRRIVRGIFGREVYGRWELSPSSPALAWAFRNERAEADGAIQFYTPEQVEALLDTATDAMDAAIWTLATQAGPRQSEIRAMTVGQVDFQQGVIVIDKAYTTRGGLAGTKSHKIRSMPLLDETRKALVPFCAGKDRDALVFENLLCPGQPLAGYTMHRRLQAAAKRAKLPILRFHHLRHTYGTFAVGTWPVTDVQHYMGHANIQTTMRYVHYTAKPEAANQGSQAWAAAKRPVATVVAINPAARRVS